jgi:hypothetical protein
VGHDNETMNDFSFPLSNNPPPMVKLEVIKNNFWTKERVTLKYQYHVLLKEILVQKILHF